MGVGMRKPVPSLATWSLLNAFLLLLPHAATAQDGPWDEMDYGPFLSAAIEVSPDNIACKGIAIPLSRDGDHAALFDTAELRWAAAWEGDFVELRGIVYDGPHGTWPEIAGEPDWQNPAGPGVTLLKDQWEDPREVPYGPLPPGKGRWQGLQRDRQGVLLHYSLGEASVFERMAYLEESEVGFWKRSIHLRKNSRGLQFSLMELEEGASLEADRASRGVWTLRFSDGSGFLLGFENQQKWRMVIEGQRLILQVPPTTEDVYCHLYLSRFEEEPPTRQFELLRRRTYLINPSPLGETWGTGSFPTLYGEKLELAGKIGFRIDETGVLQERQRFTGSLPADRNLELGEKRRVQLLDLKGEELKFPAPLEKTVLIVEETLPPAPLAGWNCDESSGEKMQSVVDGEKDLLLDGVTWRRGVQGRALDFDGKGKARWLRSPGDALFDNDFTFSAWICTTKDGSIFSQTHEEGPWIPGGKTFFIRDGRLCFDVGWVGVIEGDRFLADGRWHHVGFSWDAENFRVELFVDGVRETGAILEPENETKDTVTTIGFAAEDFPAEPWFSGYMDGLRLHRGVLDEEQLRAVASEGGEPLIEALAITGEIENAIWEADDERAGVVLTADPQERRVVIHRWNGPLSQIQEFLGRLSPKDSGQPADPFEIDRISWPEENPWNSWMRFGDFDFLDGGQSAVISTWSGDVWRVDGLDEDLQELQWQRIASGLSQPLGLLTRDLGDGEQVLVMGRDQITELVDIDGDGETDLYRGFNVDPMNSPHFHEPAVGLQEGPQGKLYYLKAARHAKLPLHPQHGTLIEVEADGSTSRVIATGFRAPNGLAVDSDELFWGSDQEGHWMPANRINRITRGSFQGNHWSGSMLSGAREVGSAHDPPLLWIHPTVDRSPSAQLRIPENEWAELSGKLLGLSYGTGEVYLILEDEVDGKHQGAFVPLPIEIPTGAMRGRFHPDGSLYLCGLFGWSSDKTEPGGFYRVRKTAAPLTIPLSIRAVDSGLLIEFSEAITTPVEELAGAFKLQGWNYRYSSNYGSPRLTLEDGTEGVSNLQISQANLSADLRRVHLTVEDIQPAMQMHLDWSLSFGDIGGKSSFVHFTVHQLAGDVKSE
ncbi:MAG: hypothetical protein CBC13_07975 [Planctomycetia bacterium TMED53]|nr:MAG: hypothetical protein CBC13_07975 [Planctomycetia bacterium TMED53]